MGCCCRTPEGQKQRSKSNSSEVSPLKLSTTLSWNKENKIALQTGCSFGQPLLHGKNELLFISSLDNCIIITCYNMKTKKYNEPEEIPCKSFDIQQCQYTFDTKNNLIYFINKNKQIMTLSLNTKTLISKHDITTENDKYTQIEKFKDKIYILGAADDEKQSNDNFIFVPYDAYKQNGFGNGAVTIHVKRNKKNYIYIVGGDKQYQYDLHNEKKAIYAPCDTIWILDLSLTDKSGIMMHDIDSKWTKRYLLVPMTSFGIINYKNKYLITFGGFQLVKRKNEFVISDEIYVLDLDNDGQWYVLKKKLQSKCGYFALYDDKFDIIHLFAWNGRHYTVKIKDIINAINNNEYSAMQLWTEQGKTALPTKSKSIRNMGPKIADSDDEDY